MKLQFNNLTDILDWIKNPEHKEHLFLLETAINAAKGSTKGQFKVGDHVIFGRTNGRKRPGVIVSITGPKRAVVKDTNLGGKWRVPYSLMEVA